MLLFERFAIVNLEFFRERCGVYSITLYVPYALIMLIILCRFQVVTV